MLVCSLALVLAVTLAACGTTTAGGGATATATAHAAAASFTAAQATRMAQPVTIESTLVQRGTVATHDVQLIATATIANHTDAAIHLAGSACQIDFAHTTGGVSQVATIAVAVNDASGHAVWQSFGWVSCPAGEAEHIIDVQEVPATSTFTATLACDMSSCGVPGAVLQMEVPYAVKVTILLWHQGTPEQYLQAYNHPEQSGVLWGSNLSVELPFTFR